MKPDLSQDKLSARIDHTVLKPSASWADVEQAIQEAQEHGFYGLCVAPYWLCKAHKKLEGGSTKLVTVVGFPLGYETPFATVASVSESLKNGADEIDLVWNLSAFKSGMHQKVKEDIEVIRKMVHDKSALLKVILETAYLNDEELKQAAGLMADIEPDFVKTSTGFGPSGANLDQVKVLKQHLPPHIRIKVSGGIKTKEQALSFLAAGAERIGTSASVQIVSG